MGWAVGEYQGRDIGYGVPAVCDQPQCGAEIDRGLAYVCGRTHSGDGGCGRYFCGEHLWLAEEHDGNQCAQCLKGEPEVEPTPDTRAWVQWKLKDASWARWRSENPDWVKEHS